MRRRNFDATRESWSQLVLRDSFSFMRSFVVGWLGLLGGWNSLVAPLVDWPAISPGMAAVLVAGWIIGLIFTGD